MTYLANGKLKPLADHNSVVIVNRYLVVLGGYIENSDNSSEILSDKHPSYKFYSLYNLTVFDSHTRNWETINIKPSLFDTSKVTLQFKGLLAAVYREKSIVLGGFIGEDVSGAEYNNSYLGILNYYSRTWTWNPIRGDDGNSFINGMGLKLLVYNNQLIMSSGILKISFYISTNLYNCI
jgi:hypothetical protein